MLQTLLKIGRWQSDGKSGWDRFLDYPNPETKDKQGNAITNYTLPIIFDLDENKVIIDSKQLREYDEEKIIDAFPLKVKGGNNKAIYTSVPSNKLNQLYKTFFGKEGEETQKGELAEAVTKLDANLLTQDFKNLLERIFRLKENFLVQTQDIKKNGDKEVSIKAINSFFKLEKNEKIVFIKALIKGKEFGFDEPLPFAQVPEYRTFLERSYFKNPENESKGSGKKLCYASGEEKEDVEELDLSTRYSLNKMFVTETRNYANLFEKKNFSHNYQVSKTNQKYLDYASNFLLNEGFKTRIANVDHVIIPEFQSRTLVNWKSALEGIKKKTDLLFNFRSLDSLAKNIKEEMDEDVFWINFVAFESDGNFFKATETIKDVSNFHFSKVLKTFGDLDWAMRKAKFVDWEKVMTEYKEPRFFNLNTIYSLIPLRKDKEKKNKALDLFKAILENRRVQKEKLYDYFCELILCHWYERYNSYTNVPKSSQEYFSISARDSVFKYLAFFQVLKQLKLINMEENNHGSEELTDNEYDQAIRDFFKKMDMLNREDQQAMFYLGRMLNSVEWIQLKKDIKKTVIHLVNFNGLDQNAIQRLRNNLMNKACQHNEIGKVKYLNGKFGDKFQPNNWKMLPQEALFFLLTGYSFRFTSTQATKQEEVEKEAEEQLN